MKKIAPFILVGFLTISLMGCGGNSNAPQATTIAESVEETTVQETTVEETTEEVVYAESIISIDKVCYEKIGNIVNVCLLVRNVSNETLDSFMIFYNALDKDGVVVENRWGGESGIFLEPEQAVWTVFQDNNNRNSSSLEEYAEKEAKLIINYVQIADMIKGVQQNNRNYDFEKKIEIITSELKEK